MAKGNKFESAVYILLFNCSELYSLLTVFLQIIISNLVIIMMMINFFICILC